MAKRKCTICDYTYDKEEGDQPEKEQRGV
ncbi:MAG: rubredoxin [Theionarchaea archaeon]|nr:rubredoxin [Theionarchaea archaeon]